MLSNEGEYQTHHENDAIKAVDIDPSSLFSRSRKRKKRKKKGKEQNKVHEEQQSFEIRNVDKVPVSL